MTPFLEIVFFKVQLALTLPIRPNKGNNDNNFSFRLENKRNLDRKTINLLRNKEISTIIN